MARQVVVPVPFRIRTANAWLFPGDQPALIDCGVATPEAYEAIMGALREEGVAAHDLRLYITHGHVDHAGNAARLRREHGVALQAPRAEAPHVETFRRDSHTRNDAFAAALRRHGMPEDRVRALRARSDDVDQYLEDVPIQHDLPHGQRLILGDVEATALRTPGHTPGSTCYLTEDNDLLTGDTLLERITSNAIELLDEDHGAYHQYVRSVESLRAHAGCQALPGHRAPFQITDEVIDRHLQNHTDRARTVLAALDRPKTAWHLLPHVFPGLDRQDQLFMAMAEIVGHLHALEIEGKARRVEADGAVRFVQ